MLEVLVEEPSAEAMLRTVIPRIVGDRAEFEIRVFQGKPDLVGKLPQRLAGYGRWIQDSNTKVVILLDRDDDDCIALKRKIEGMASAAGLSTRADAGSLQSALVLTRIAVEELEAWFLGDVPALREVYPRVSGSLGQQARFRDPDAVVDTWRALERLLNSHGYHKGGLRKVQNARDVAAHMNVEGNQSHSFVAFRDGLRSFVGGDDAPAQ
jgi:Domain of unknown function (DUF4276)